MRMRVAVFCAAFVAALALWSCPGHAAEEIKQFHSDITVHPDGALTVTETIRVNVEGDQIKRGIYRLLPIEYREEDGRISLADFSIQRVTRNGEAAPFAKTRRGSDLEVRIGRANVFLPTPSEQVYEITYRTTGHLRALDEVDELYWNVTGNDWAFPILQASVAIHLPEGTPIIQHAAYTGPQGASGSDYEVIAAQDGLYRARTTSRLGRREGFTVAVGWPKGTVDVPPVQYGVPGIGGYAEPPMTLGGERLGPYAALIGTLIGLNALFLLWSRVGRDPQKGAIYPQFDPPPKLSPAATRYIQQRGFDRRCMTAAILSMAVKGAVRIVEEEKGGLFGGTQYKLEPLGLNAGQPLSEGERAAYSALFPGGEALTLKRDKTNGKRVDKARKQLRSKLWDEHYGASFTRNTLYSLGGIAIGAGASLGLIGVVERWNVLSLLQWGLPAVAAGLAIFVAGLLWRELRDLFSGGRLDFGRLRRLLVPAIFAVFFFTGPVAALAELPVLFSVAMPGIFFPGAAFGIIAGIFHFLMAAPSKAGQKLIEQIEGFEMYVRTAEEDRLEMLNPPEKTPERFEKLLPYAVALGISHEWSAKFAGVLSVATAAGGTSQVWYYGSGRFDVDSFESDFSHAVASTSQPSSRGSGGSGGGGFSGGGGGGGGGGGW